MPNRKKFMFVLPSNISALKRQYLATGKVSVGNFIDPEIAMEMREEIRTLPWELAFVQSGTPCKLPISEVKQFPAAKQAKLFTSITDYARTHHYSFAYDTYMLVTHYLAGSRPDSWLHQYVEQVCSPTFVNFMRELTGCEQIIKADGQATRFLPGHFLKQHNDDGTPNRQVRHAAYTLSFSERWQADWGGILHLQDADGVITDSLAPVFNCLNVFAVPRNHFVSQVANYCPEQRLSIVGWFRSDRN